MNFPARRLLKLSLYVIAALLAGSLVIAGVLKLKKPEQNDLFATREENSLESEGERREDWLYQQRAYPAKSIPPEAGPRMVEQLEREETRLRLRRQAGNLREAETPEQQAVWAALGPQPINNGQTFGAPRNNVSGRISAVALDPRYDGSSNQTIYVGGAQGGVWKSTDNGVNWAPLTDGQPSIAVGAIAVDPKNPDTIYVGLGEGSRCALCYYGAGLLKSTNGGATWTLITGPTAIRDPKVPAFVNAAFTRIAIDPVNTSTVYACTTFGVTSTPTNEQQQLNLGQVGLWKSTDGGATWRNLDPGATEGTFSVHDVLLDPRNPNRVFAGMRTIGLYVSDQGGEPGTWRLLTNGLPDLGSNPQGTTSTSPVRRVALAAGPPVAPSTNATYYAAFASTATSLFGIYRSSDNGESWSRTTTPPGGQANYNLDIVVDPTDGNVVYYGTSANGVNNGGTVLRSRDGGQTWQDVSRGDGATGGLHADTHQFAFAPASGNLLFTGNDGGMWRTDNANADT
ncbi:MAG: WD40/YVTN/BNR-like repeat-containing protein, partial [Blastocatellia bacterium]